MPRTLAMLLLTALHLLAAETRLHVAPTGADTSAGTAEAPLATLAGARAAVRRLRGTGTVTVVLHAGTYRVGETFVLGPEDSGSAEAPVTWMAQPGEHVVISGGKAITGWHRAEGELWTATVPEVAAGRWYFQQLWVNGSRAIRARTPNTGYLRTAGRLPGIDPAKARETPEAKIGFRFQPGDLKAWDNLGDVSVVPYHSWTTSRHTIASLDEAKHEVRFRNANGWPFSQWEEQQRYVVENYREALDSPGEWYLDRQTGLLTYWPRPGEDMTRAEVTAAAAKPLLKVEGDAEAGLSAGWLTLRGLSFQHADWAVDAPGVRPDSQSAMHVGAAVQVGNASHVTFDRCEIAHVGEYGVWLDDGAQACTLRGCHLWDLGAGGVRIGTSSTPASARQASDGNVIDNCFIHDGGHVYAAGAGVVIQRASHNQVTHNEICDFYYTGVSVGWSWGYAPTTAHDNVVADNHIHHLGWGVLSDMGGIYCLGDSPGTKLTGNLIHHVLSYSYGGWGLYTDEGSTGILLENNVVYRTKTGGFHQHYGKDNIVRNNVFAFASEGQLQRTRNEDHRSFTFERNLVLYDNGDLLAGNWSNDQFESDHNLFWDASGNDPEFSGASLEAWRKRGHDPHSVVADPLFVNPAQGDFNLRPGSPALALGFRPIDISHAGLYGDATWVALPKAVQRADMAMPGAAPASPIHEDFETTAVGAPPTGATVGGTTASATVAVTDELASSGRHCLKVVDAAGLAKSYYPLLQYRPNLRSGVATGSFALRLEPGAVFYHEWRDGASPYHAGPSLRIVNGKLTAAGKVLATLPLSTWVKLSITCGLARTSDGTWSLTVETPGAAPQRFAALACVSPQFKRLDWYGFVSDGETKAAFYLDAISLDTAKR